MADVATLERTSAELVPVPAPARKPSESASVAELVDAILDKGIVIESCTSAGVLGLELLSVQARVEAVSVATYLRHAETMCRAASAL